MTSNDHTEVANALIATSMLITTEMIPAVIGPVASLLTHKREFVRKRALLALHRFYQLDKSSICHLNDQICKMLCDADPSVMTACVVLLDDICKDDPTIGKNLVPSLVSIQKQIIEQRLPRDYDYHNIPAPWVQIKLIRLLSRLGYGDQTASEKMYAVIADTMARADAGTAIGHAISYECVRCVVHIYPNAELLDSASKATAFFINNPMANLKYLGLCGLLRLVKTAPAVVAKKSYIYVNCLKANDSTIRSKALSLIQEIANPKNLKNLVEDLITCLRSGTEFEMKEDIISGIVDMCSRDTYKNTQDFAWFVSVLVDLAKTRGSHSGEVISQRLIDVTLRVPAVRLMAVNSVLPRLLQPDSVCERMKCVLIISFVLWDPLP